MLECFEERGHFYFSFHLSPYFSYRIGDEARVVSDSQARGSNR